MSYDTVERAILNVERNDWQRAAETLQHRQDCSLTVEKAEEALTNRLNDEVFLETDTFSQVMYAIAGLDFGYDQGLDVFIGGLIERMDGTPAIQNNQTPSHLMKAIVTRCLKDIAIRLLEAADSFEEGPPCAVRPSPGHPVEEFTVRVTRTITQEAVFNHRTMFPQHLRQEVTRKSESHNGIYWDRGKTEIEYEVLQAREIHYED